MNLRFAARGDGATLHLVVARPIRFGEIVRKRGEALCKPRLPNLETLDRQIADGRQWCADCIDVMERIRRKQPIELPSASGLVAADLIRQLRREREAARPPRRRRAANELIDR